MPIYTGIDTHYPTLSETFSKITGLILENEYSILIYNLHVLFNSKYFKTSL